MIFTRDKSFYRSLFGLCAPMALGNLITFLITLTDSVMIGRLGESATASVYVGTLAATVLQMLISGVEGGITVGASQHWGRGERESIRKIAAIGTALILTLGAALTVISLVFSPKICAAVLTEGARADGSSYLRILSFSFILFSASGALGSVLRSVESPSVVTFASFAAFIINLILDYFLIFGKLMFSKMGIVGAAVATIIARAFEFLILLIYVLFIDKKIKMRRFSSFKPKKDVSLSFIKYTYPIVLGQIIWIINTLFSSLAFASLKSDVAVTGFSIANTLNSLSYIVMNGLSGAVGIIIGKAVGENKRERLKEYAYTTQIIFIILGAVTSLTLLALRSPFVSLYNISEQTRDIALGLISVLSVTIIGTSYQSACLVGIVRGGGDTSFILKNDAFFIFLLVIPLTLISLRLGAPIWLVFLALKSDQILKCIPAAIKINRFRWAKNLTHKP